MVFSVLCIFALKLLLKKQCCAYILYQRRVKIVGKEGKRSKREENVINPKEGAKRRFGPSAPPIPHPPLIVANANKILVYNIIIPYCTCRGAVKNFICCSFFVV